MRHRYERVAARLIDARTGQVDDAPDRLERAGGPFGGDLYSTTERHLVPAAALAASLGCGSPTEAAHLRPGLDVLDLGCGGGIDLILAAGSVGAEGRIVGVDLSPLMLKVAGANLTRASVQRFALVLGAIEALPIGDATFDRVIANCSVNLSGDKAATLSEAARVLRPDGELVVSDVVADDELTPADRHAQSDTTGMPVGVLSVSEYAVELAAAGLRVARLQSRHRVAEGMTAVTLVARLAELDA